MLWVQGSARFGEEVKTMSTSPANGITNGHHSGTPPGLSKRAEARLVQAPDTAIADRVAEFGFYDAELNPGGQFMIAAARTS